MSSSRHGFDINLSGTSLKGYVEHISDVMFTYILEKKKKKRRNMSR